MPFPSNEMNATRAGLNLKYTCINLPGLSLIAGGNYTISGRNVGQSTTVYGGVFYVLDFAKKKKTFRYQSKINNMKKNIFYTILVFLAVAFVILVM